MISAPPIQNSKFCFSLSDPLLLLLPFPNKVVNCSCLPRHVVAFRGIETGSTYMRRPTSYTGILLLSLILSGSGNVLAAAFCTHAQLPACCKTKSMQDSMPSHEMTMEGMDMSAASAEADINSVGQPAGVCAHCMSHSDLPAKAVAAVSTVEQSRRDLSAGNPALAQRKPLSSTALFAPLLSSRPHAPPGTRAPRYLLISALLI